MRVSLIDIPDLISILFSIVVLALLVWGITSPPVISSGVVAVLLARIVGFWSNRAAIRLSSLERNALQMLRKEGEISYDDCEANLQTLAGEFTGGDLLKSLIAKKAVKIVRQNGGKVVKPRFGSRFL